MGQAVENGSEASDWKVAHEHLLRLAKHRSGLDLEEGRWLLLAYRTGAHVRLGYGSFGEYVERVFGYSPRLTHDKLRVAEALEVLPEMPKALKEGQLSWSAARELTRVATAATERDWLAAARGRTVRDVERLVSGHEMGSRPQDPVNPNARRHVLRYEVSGETLAAFRDAAAKLRRDSGGPLDDDAMLLLMARHVLGGPRDEGRASYQVALTVCESCKKGQQHAQGELVDASPEAMEMASCDPQHLGSTHVGQPTRATQDVTPAVRRMVLRRDHGQCVFPGCRHSVFVDIHHIEYRSRGGDHEPDNLVTLCAAHHRAIHRGDVILVGPVSTGLRFYHADGTEYGNVANVAEDATDSLSSLEEELSGLQGEPPARLPDVARRRRMASRALRRMGFGQRETDIAIDEAATHVGQQGTLEALLRYALKVLTGDMPQAS
jgi:hypothetical protein